MPKIANCPACDEQLVIPPGVERSASVRCPLCDTAFDVANATLTEPPEAVVLDLGQGSNSAAEKPDQASVDNEVQDSDVRDDVPLEVVPPDNAVAPSFDFGDTDDIPQRVDLGPYEAARQVLATPLPQRKPKSLLRQLLGVFGGGIIGLLLGYYILLWIGGPDMDFLEIGENLPEWAVPASFHEDSLAGNVPSTCWMPQ